MPKKKSGKKAKKSIKSTKAKGLGDTVEKVLEATGISKVAKFILGEDCGCDERKAKLNSLWRYTQPKCLQEDEHEWLNEWYTKRRETMRPSDQRRMLEIYNRIFDTNQQATQCSSCLREINTKMFKVYETYEDANS